jgi:hypothetical protein
LVAQFQYNKSDDTYTCPKGEILKPREDGTRKAVELSKAVISLRNTEHPLAKLSSKPFAPVEQQVEKLTEANMPMPWKKTTNAIRKIQLYRTGRRLTNIYLALKKTMGQSHHLTGLEK